jgi:hypothetical protein
VLKVFEEKVLPDDDKLAEIRYTLDIDAATREQRAVLNSPVGSPLCNLKGDLLPKIMGKSVPGIARPYAYQSHTPFGAPFTIHCEDFDIFSANFGYNIRHPS